MKAIIDRKRYDTETTECLGSDSGGGYSMRDFRYWEETLYRTRSGAFFLAGQGGALSHYSQPCPDGQRGGERITPMTAEEAYRWAEQHLEAEKVETLFPDRVQDA